MYMQVFTSWSTVVARRKTAVTDYSMECGTVEFCSEQKLN
jgi:hypothetical protein